MRRVITYITLVIPLAFLPAVQVAAQQADQQADRIHAQALVLQQDQTKLVAAARLYLREAAIRGDDDPQTVKCLSTAAHLLFYGKRTAESRRVMARAADIALGHGDVWVAAQTYLLTAWLAQADRDPADAARIAHKAELLARSPLLASAGREAILARVNRVITVSLR